MVAVAKHLQKAEINIDEYKRGPLGKDIFTLSVRPVGPEGLIKIWEGLADIEPHISKKHRQAVLNVVENKREISKKITFFSSEYDTDRSRALAAFRGKVVIPENAKLSLTNVEDKYDNQSDLKSRWKRGLVTATIPKNSQSLLMGMDETYHFIAALPKKVDSVAEAHEVLRPSKLPKDTIRQGEWFFSPVEDKLNAVLTNTVTANTNRRRMWQRLEANSTHMASHTTWYRGKRYVAGFIADGRKSHHKPIYLERWHLVTRNRETQISNANMFRRTWD